MLGNQRLTPGGKVKRAKPKQKSVKKRQTDQARLMRHIICMKWGTKYEPYYVNNLYAMARRHLSGEFRFICLTDDAKGIRSEVECFPIPPVDIKPEAAGVPRPRLEEAHHLQPRPAGRLWPERHRPLPGPGRGGGRQPGRILHPAGRVPASSRTTARPWRVTGNSSVYRFEIGGLPDVLDYFRANEVAVREQFRNEQTYLSDYLHEKGKLQYWPERVVPQLQVPRHSRCGPATTGAGPSCQRARAS